MKRIVLHLLAVAMLFAASGCVAATVKNNRFGADREVVAVGDRVYIVNKTSGQVREVDMASAKPFVPETDDDDNAGDSE